MCHALPVKIVALTGPDTAKVSLGGIVKEISVALIDDPQPGDYVVLHVGYALAKIDEAEAKRTLGIAGGGRLRRFRGIFRGRSRDDGAAMKHLDEFRDADTARRLAATIAREAATGRRYRLMEFCGGHTHAISRYGIEDLLPANIEMIHGPGCPVCVLPIGRIDMAIRAGQARRRHPLHLRRHAARARLQGPVAC